VLHKVANQDASNVRCNRGAGGMSLIEVLVALVVVSVGALSATSLQIVTKRSNRDAAQRLEATHLASTLVERMRANNSPDGLRTYATLAQYSVSTPRPMGGGVLSRRFNLNCQSSPASCCLSTTSTCSSSQSAAVELWQLEQLEDGVMEQIGASAGGLNSPTTCISGPATPGRDGFYTVTVAFRGSLAMAEDTAVLCGHNATDASGVPLYGTSNEYRRTLTVAAYITPTVPK
jgi:type IV pilus modification protein PilV